MSDNKILETCKWHITAGSPLYGHYLKGIIEGKREAYAEILDSYGGMARGTRELLEKRLEDCREAINEIERVQEGKGE